MKKLSIIFVVFGVSGCETPEQQLQRLLPEAQKRCDAFGYSQDSDAYSNCIRSEVARLEDREAALAASIAAAADGFAEGYEAANSSSTTCYTTGMGAYQTTTCY